ncbi:MAG: InlB B-repeat-containing protein, partial [Oscillospiraceae bacterium]|nr:InlB B-repeat-containing protein [Oscillospiraceae bacterium]
MQNLKRLLAILLVAVLIIGVLPMTGFAEEKVPEEKEVEENEHEMSPELPLDQERNYGLINQYHVGTKAVTDAYLRGDSFELNGVNVSNPVRDLPSKYDSRDYNYVTAMKNQNPYGSCWAHAAMASVESYMIKHGVPVGTGAAATTSLNLSETQHCFFNYSTAYDAEGMTNGDACTLTGSDSCLDSGGNGEMSAYTLQHWTGVADESVSALTYSKASTVASSGLNSQYAYGSNVAHVQNSEWIPGTNIEAVKQAIMDYGAGNISYYETGSAYTYACTIDTTSQDSSSHKWANHAITVVGWDDTIAVSNFKPNKPSSPGAWLCKNSWGTGYFNQGYMYISYEDTTVLEGYIYFYDAESIDNYDHNYQYDGSCNVVNYGKGWNSSINTCDGFANNTQVANVFTAKGSEQLDAVAFCSWDEGMTYTVDIYKNPTTGNPSSGTKMTTQTGTLTFSGYYTIKLDNPVSLAAGDTFSVVITQNVPVADDNGSYVHTPYDASFNNSNVVSWAKWTHVNHGNTSYYKEPNGSWTDCPDNGDYRIKAYTDDVTFNVTAVSNNTAWGTVSVNGTTITASPAAGYYVSGYEVVSGTATATINQNIINVAPETDCTIRVIFAPKPTYTVNFVASGASEGSQSALIYDTITLPSTVGVSAAGWTFSGWVTSQFDETTEEPEIYAPGAEYTVTDNTTLYAVYTRVEGSTDLVYELVADNREDWSGNYVITSGKDTSLIALKTTYSDQRIENSTSGASVAYANTGMTLDGNLLRNVPADYVFEIAKSGSAYTIKNNNSGYWIGTQSTYLHNMGSYIADYSDWTMEYDLYNICMKIANVASTQYTYLVVGSNKYFVVNTGYTTNKTQLWRETTESVTYYWTDPVVAEHTHELEHIAAVAPTCGAEGNVEYWRCTVCGKLFSDAAGENEITLESTVLPATGNHTFGAYVSNNDGTHKHVCTVCGAEETENCTYTDVVTPPTATEQGYTTHTCTVCGYSFVDSYTAPLGNDYPVHFSVPAGITAPADMISNTNTGITLPTAEAPEGYTFLGWVTEDYDNVETRPANILTGTYVAPQEITLKALYTYTEGGSGTETVYELLSAAPADLAGSYVITYGVDESNTNGFYLMQGMAAASSGYGIESASNRAAFADTGATLEGTTLKNVADDYVFIVEFLDPYYSIHSKTTGTYLGMNTNSYLSGYSSYSSSYCRWTIPAVADNFSSAKNARNGSYPYISFGAQNTGDELYFWAGSSNSIGATGAAQSVRWWKAAEIEAGTAYYTTIISEPAHEHTPAEPVIENNVEPTCTEAGHYDSVVYCTECGEEISRETVTVPATGHAYGAPEWTWTADNTAATAKFTCANCGDEHT